MTAERGADFHQLKAGFQLLDQHVDLDGAGGEADVQLERGDDVVPERRFLRRLDLRQIQHDRRAVLAELCGVVHDVQHEVDDRRRESGAVGAPDVAVVEMQPARPEDAGRELELLLPVLNHRTAEKLLRPLIDFGGHLAGDVQEQRIVMKRQLQVALVVERHRPQLAERVLAVEHPAVGAGQQGVRDVADAALDRAAAFGAGPGPLNPLTAQVGGNLTAREPAGARVRDADVGPRNPGVRVEKVDSLPGPRALVAARETAGHDRLAFVVERHQHFERHERFGGQDIVVVADHVSSEFQLTHAISPLPFVARPASG